jgi:hypothetical protein
LLKRRGEAGARIRMAVPKRAPGESEASKDRRLRELLEAGEAGRLGEVVVQLAENSTCKTCKI